MTAEDSVPDVKLDPLFEQEPTLESDSAESGQITIEYVRRPPSYSEVIEGQAYFGNPQGTVFPIQFNGSVAVLFGKRLRYGYACAWPRTPPETMGLYDAENRFTSRNARLTNHDKVIK